MSIKNAILQIQFQYTKLFTLGLNRKIYSVENTENELIAENSSRNTYIALIFTFLTALLLISGIIEAFVNETEITLEFIIVFWIVHICLGLIGLRQFLWLLKGKHILKIKDCVLTLEKHGTFLTKPKKYQLNLISNLRTTEDEENLNLYNRIQNNITLGHKLLFGHTYGQVTFEYQKKKIKVFSDLTQKEKIELVERIENEIENCHQQSI